jgi:hypothetical protein
MARVLCMLVVAAVLTLTTSVTQAAGPLDGAYFAVQSFPDGHQESGCVVVLQNGASIAFALLDPFTGWWSYAFGTLHLDGQIMGGGLSTERRTVCDLCRAVLYERDG